MFLITFHRHRDGYHPPRDRRRTWADRIFCFILLLSVFVFWLLSRLAGW